MCEYLVGTNLVESDRIGKPTRFDGIQQSQGTHSIHFGCILCQVERNLIIIQFSYAKDYAVVTDAQGSCFASQLHIFLLHTVISPHI